MTKVNEPGMTFRQLVDPELVPLIDLFEPITKSLALEVLPAMRAQAVSITPFEPDRNVIKLEKSIPGPAGAPDVRVLIYKPTMSMGLLPGYFYIHGGGYLLGSPEMSEAANYQLAAQIGCVVVSVDYRLAPETPHPGPVEDCYAALRWMYENAHELGVDRKRIAIGGESAGGGLAAALALVARDRGEVPVIFQMLAAPMLDDRTCVRDDLPPYAGEFIWTKRTNCLGWKALLGCEPGSPGISPYAAAARAENLAGLPPAFIAVGALDLFLEEDIEYARRLVRAGVPVELHVYPGALHGFEIMANAQVTINAMQARIAALKKAFLLLPASGGNMPKATENAFSTLSATVTGWAGSVS